ncbi:hypothetical protein ACIQM4_03190 [Streptomyces sp. NPDC091272]|uniref:hypothetical protein n=1 Tax=Streptomyces sp. NPDC091272 TaxID=3365981 RepID=UPI0037FD2DC7
MPAQMSRTATTSAATLLCVPLLLLGAGTSASAAEKDPPHVSIDLTDGVETVRPGAGLRYTVTVLNHGPARLAGLRVEQQLPPGASGPSAGQRAKVAGGKAVWTTDVPGYGRAVLTSRATLGTEAAGALRAASTVCAYLSTSEVPVVCSSDMNLVSSGSQGEGPPGMRARSVASADGIAESTLLGVGPAVAIGSSAGATLLAVTGVLALRRRRRARTPRLLG